MKVLTIGRDTTNDIIIDDVKISRHQAQLIISDSGKCSIVDLGSTNGTYVNNHRISGEVTLSDGDIVTIGSTILPWQNYMSQFPTPSSNNSASPKTKSKAWIFIVAIVATIMLIGGGIAAYLLFGADNSGEKPQPANIDSTLVNNNSDKDYIEALEGEIEIRDQKAKDKLTKANKAHKKAMSDKDEAHKKEMSEKDTAHKNALDLKDKEIQEAQNQAQKTASKLNSKNQELENENQSLNEAINEQSARIDQLLSKTLETYLYEIDDNRCKQAAASITNGAMPQTVADAKAAIKKAFNGTSTEKKYEILDIVNFYYQYDSLDNDAKNEVALILDLNAAENKTPKDEEILKKFNVATASVKKDVITYIESLPIQ